MEVPPLAADVKRPLLWEVLANQKGVFSMPTRPQHSSTPATAALLDVFPGTSHNGRCSLCQQSAEVIDVRLTRADYTIIAGQLCELCLDAFRELLLPSRR